MQVCIRQNIEKEAIILMYLTLLKGVFFLMTLADIIQLIMVIFIEDF
jgi:hypothetical protein